MRIIIVGAGEVGTHIASRLCDENDHDVVVVEKDSARCQRIRDKYNVQVVQGSGIHPEILERAGLQKAALVVAVTQSDSVNLMVSLISRLAGVENQKRVVRLESRQLYSEQSQKLMAEVGADLVIDPDQAVADSIDKVLDFGYPGVAEHVIFGEGQVIMVGAHVQENASFLDEELSQIANRYGNQWPYIIGAISRDGETFIPRSNNTIQHRDTVRVICLAERVGEFMNDLGVKDKKKDINKKNDSKRNNNKSKPAKDGFKKITYSRVMVVGGGRTGEFLAQRLGEKNIRVTVVERDPERTRKLAEKLPKKVTVEQWDVAEADALSELSIDRYDAIVALTGSDEINILACMYAKSKGVKEIIARLHGLELRTLAEGQDIDIAYSPRTACADEVLEFILAGGEKSVQQVATFLSMDIDVLDYVVEAASPVAGKRIGDMDFDKNFLIGAVLRNYHKNNSANNSANNDRDNNGSNNGSDANSRPEAFIARGDTMLAEGDHLVVFVKSDKADEVAKYFSATNGK